MYLHIGDKRNIPTDEILGFFNIGTNDNYLMIGYKKGSKAFVFTDTGEVLFSKISLSTLKERFQYSFENNINRYDTKSHE